MASPGRGLDWEDADRPPLERLEARLASYRSLVVAFSGGVDSAVLLATAHRVLADRVIAVIADSPSLPRLELHQACDLAAQIGVRLEILPTTEVDRPEYIANDRGRCYFCKQTLFHACSDFARESAITDIAYGYTLDDASDIRPGHTAAQQFGVHAPLHDARLRKADVRAVARELGLPVWDKPAAPCLSSRIPHGTTVTRDKLAKIEGMESVLHDLGFAECRARFDGSSMRIEVPSGEIGRLATDGVRDVVLRTANLLAIPFLSIDLEGFASGKLHRTVA